MVLKEWKDIGEHMGKIRWGVDITKVEVLNGDDTKE